MSAGPCADGWPEADGWSEHPDFPEVDADEAGWAASVVFDDELASPLHGSISLPAAEGLSAEGALAVAESSDRLIAWATAMKLRALARLERSLAQEPPARRECQPARFGGAEAQALAVAEAATAGAVSEGTAARLLHDAADLTGDAAEVLEALQCGRISYQHARAILDQCRTLPPGHAAGFAREGLARAVTSRGRRRTPAELRSCLRRLRERLHPESLDARKGAAAAQRGLWFAPEPDGMCTLSARLPAEAGLAIFNGLDRDARAAARAGAQGTRPQLRADALAHRLLSTPHDSFRAEVAVTIPIGLALGAGEAPEEGAGPRDAAELEGYGPIDAATARRLAALAPGWERIFTDMATGAALGVGRTAYRPPAALRRYLAHRDRGCIFPGCTRPERACEPDHTTEWQDGGTTDAENLALLCPRHHALKSLGAWTYHRTGPHAHTTWTSPLGRTHTTAPEDHREQPETPPPQDPPPF